MRKIFIDCGTNTGGGIAHFHTRYNFGPDWELYLFEANPYLKNFILENIVSKNPQMSIYLIDRAVSGRKADEEVEFRLERVPEYDFPAGGGSTFLGASDGLSETEVANYETVTVKTIRLSDFIMHLMQSHTRIEGETAVLQKGECMVVLKLDIEGAEYEVIQDLLNTGAAWALTDIHIEFHGRRFVENKRDEEVRLVGELFQRGVNVFSHF